ncbi:MULTISPECIES: immunity protein Tsi6 family protein [Pseudomonas aeruginosa group]|nr:MULTISPECIES: immunity protein Tsi6 family protein [Pseudomonas aeruginosa group]MBH8713750.1 hypothetical protein [Pseudomonas aeruginosa]MBH9346067.1 hypothetical protein [Pseudomonas aeruginosa]MBH9399389.1 hypothetical protein [Pseudomonas aeruginosa]MBI8113268.1 hypothetical protein [Pseudomonas aeruginosa]MDT1023845.1 immunity protein Tsi6 family protein [Pseudomonas paraeruginosa]
MVPLGHQPNRAALHRIGISAIAVKEFDETDVELAEALKAAH